MTRALVGLSLAGVAAVAMTYLAEEVHPEHLGYAMGLYISGNALGGMSGRVISGVLVDFVSWRIALGALGVLALVAAVLFKRSLPASKRFQPRPLRPRSLLAGYALHFRDAGLPWLFLEAFLLMGAFVTLFNYIAYRLLAEPYHLSQAWMACCRWSIWRGSTARPSSAAWPIASAAAGIRWRHRTQAVRAAADPVHPAVAGAAGHAAVHLRLLRCPLRGQQLGGAAGAPGAWPGVVALSVQLLAAPAWLAPWAVSAGHLGAGPASACSSAPCCSRPWPWRSACPGYSRCQRRDARPRPLP